MAVRQLCQSSECFFSPSTVAAGVELTEPTQQLILSVTLVQCILYLHLASVVTACVWCTGLHAKKPLIHKIKNERNESTHINYIHIYCTVQHSEICIVVNIHMTSHSIVCGGNIFVCSLSCFQECTWC